VIDKLPRIETHQHDPIEALEKIIAGMPNPPEIIRAGSQAFYSPLTDRVTLPPRELFISAESESATILHELVHSSGSEKRLAREGLCEAAPFGSPIYSKEELTAEFGAAYLCTEARISNAVIDNQTAYLAGWLARLRDDRKLLIHAAAQARVRRITFSTESARNEAKYSRGAHAAKVRRTGSTQNSKIEFTEASEQ
jgi:antirestriction protein ArdC